MKQLSISVLLLLTYWVIYAQEKNKPINATDGTIDAYVEVTWLPASGEYKIIVKEKRNPSMEKTVEPSQKGLYGDRGAVPGVKYIYDVYEASSLGELVIVGSDIGWRPFPPAVATIEQVRYDAELYTSSPKVQLADSVVVAQPEISGKWKANQAVGIKTVLRYIGGNQLKDVSVKVFISDDTLLDDTDELISEIAIEGGLNADITEFDETINLPKKNYKNKSLILAVAQGEQVKAITIRPL